jgi:hypothetical protein
LHFWHVSYSPLAAGKGTTDMTREGILRPRNGSTTRSLSQAITFNNGATETHLEEIKNLLVDRSRGRYHEADFSSKTLFNLVKHEFIIAAAGV